MSVLVAEHLVRRVADGAGKRTVLDGASLRADAGEMVAVSGPSGSGKSTLLSLLAGFERPDAGTVHVCGRALHDRDDDARARIRRTSVSFLFQRFHLFEGLSLQDNVIELARLLGLPGAEATRRTGAALERLGLGARRRARVATLSGGEKQRVALARVLVSDAPLVLCDEPTSALDPEAAAGVVDLLRELAAAGRCVVVATHDPRFAAAAAVTYVIEAGRLQTHSAMTASNALPSASRPST